MNNFITPEIKTYKRTSTEKSTDTENDSPKRPIKRKLSFSEEEDRISNGSMFDKISCIISKSSI